MRTVYQLMYVYYILIFHPTYMKCVWFSHIIIIIVLQASYPLHFTIVNIMHSMNNKLLINTLLFIFNISHMDFKVNHSTV